MGSANTDAIIARMAAGSVSSSDYVAGLASAYASGGYSDWFLPSKDELNAMWLYSQVVGFNTATYGFASDFYWSSSQFNLDTAWYHDFIDDKQTLAAKFVTLRVRPVRAF